MAGQSYQSLHIIDAKLASGRHDLRSHLKSKPTHLQRTGTLSFIPGSKSCSSAALFAAALRRNSCILSSSRFRLVNCC